MCFFFPKWRVKWNKTQEVTASSDFTPNQTAFISNIHVSERKLSRAVSFLILSPSQRRMQTLTQGKKNLLMGHLLAALKTSSSFRDCLLHRSLRDKGSEEINETGQHLWDKHNRTSNKAKSSEQQTVWKKKTQKNEKLPFQWETLSVVWWIHEYLCILGFTWGPWSRPLSSSSQGNACASLTLAQPDVLSWNAFSFFMKQINHACEAVVKSRRESWEGGVFRSPAVPPRTRSLQIKSLKISFSVSVRNVFLSQTLKKSFRYDLLQGLSPLLYALAHCCVWLWGHLHLH